MFKSIKKIIISIFTLVILIISYSPVLANGGIVPNEGKENGDYSLDSMILIVVNVSKWILGIVGSLTLLMFVYGGFVFIFSGGSQEKVSQGKTIIINSIIGLVIVFSSFLIIKFTMDSMGIKGWNGTMLSF